MAGAFFKILTGLETVKYIFFCISMPRFRHYLFTLGLGFLCLHRRPMIESVSLTGFLK